MSKKTTLLQLGLYAAIAILIVGGLILIESIFFPFLCGRFPDLARSHALRPFVDETIVIALSVFLVCYLISKVPDLERRIKRFTRRFNNLYRIIRHAEFGPDTGLAFIDVQGTILSTTQVLNDIGADKWNRRLLGLTYHEAFSAALSRLLQELVEKARSTRQVAAFDVPDWRPYCTVSMGAAVVYITPSFSGDEYQGAIIVVRSTSDVQHAADEAIRYQMHYQILFDSLPIGVAVFRPSIAQDDGPDGYILTANEALKKAVEGVPLPFQDPCSEVWPSFMQQVELREAIAQATAGRQARVEFFSPALGKSLEVSLSPLPGNLVLCMVIDQTEQRFKEDKLLELKAQLQRTLAGQSQYVANVLADIQHLNQATADIVETHLEQIRDVIGAVGEPEATALAEASAGLYKNLNQMLRYHNVANLPFSETSLLHPGEVVSRLLEPLSNRFPEISFEIGSLPGVVANREVLSNIIEQLMVSLAQLPVIEPPGRIEVGSQADFISTKITVAGWGFDTSSLFIEPPTELLPLDWTVTSDLDLAPVRRMVTKHGGQLFLAPTPDGMGVEFSFSIGSPAA